MNEVNIRHVLIKKKDGGYYGWINKNDVLKKFKEML